MNRPLRTDGTFRCKQDKDHHIGTLPLEKIPQINMINHFTLDFMYLGCFGVMKKLLELWSTSEKWVRRQDGLRISARLANINSQVPQEFQRTTRSLGDLGKWKACKFRFFFFCCCT